MKSSNKILHFIIMICLFITTIANAQTMETIKLWPNTVPNEVNAKHKAHQTDDSSGDIIRLTNVTDPVIEVFKPDSSKTNGASVVICPGGGYQILAIDLEGYEIAKWLNKLGYTAFVLQYRVPNNQLGALNDVQRALKIVRSNASKWKLNPDKIGVLGFSAGGSLAARASTNFSKHTYEKVDEIDTFSSKPNFAVLIYPAYLDNGDNNTLTPELTITKETPPIFLFATADDAYSSNSSLVMTAALNKHKIPVELHILASGGHGYGLRKGNNAAETWPVLTEKWLKNTLKE